MKVVDDLVRGKLSLEKYPFVKDTVGGRPQEIIVFMIHGTSYEEAHFLRKYSAQLPGISILLSGTFVHNSSTFLEEMTNMSDKFGSGAMKIT